MVANYLREQRVVPEKCDLNSILFLMTPAEDESKLNTLIAKLVKFKNLWDQDAPLDAVLPRHQCPSTASATRATPCARSATRCTRSIARRTSRSCSGSASGPRASPSSRCRRRTRTRPWSRNEVDYVPLEEIKGRIAATLALIYPPGIGVVVPGERWDDRAQPMLDYFMAFQESFNRFPGFNYEVQGVYQERIDDRIKFYTYAVRR